MDINKHNYEAYLLDYHEGRLSAKQTNELHAFVDANPDLEKELYDFEVIRLKPDQKITFKNKDVLKKSPRSFKDADLRLVPDMSITYPHKQKLRKNTIPVFRPATVRYAAAALILLLVGIPAWYVFQPSGPGLRSYDQLSSLKKLKADKIELNEKYVTRLVERKSLSMVYNNYESDIAEIALLHKYEAYSIETSGPDFQSTILYIRYAHEPIFNSSMPATNLASNESQKERGMIGKVFSGFLDVVKAPFNSREKKNQIKQKENFSIWNIAEFGVKSINALGDHDYTLVKEYNENGNVKRVRLLEE